MVVGKLIGIKKGRGRHGNKITHQRNGVYQSICSGTALLVTTGEVQHGRPGKRVVAIGMVQHRRARSIGDSDRPGPEGASGQLVVATGEEQRGTACR